MAQTDEGTTNTSSMGMEHGYHADGNHLLGRVGRRMESVPGALHCHCWLLARDTDDADIRVDSLLTIEAKS